MKIAIRYYTKTGNTKKLAKAMADAIGVEALSIDNPVDEEVDCLLLGSSYYAFDIDPEVKKFIDSLDASKVKAIVNFGSAALLNSTRKQVEKAAAAKGIPVAEEEFHCKGKFKMMHKDRPNAEDLANAAEFAKALLK